MPHEPFSLAVHTACCNKSYHHENLIKGNRPPHSSPPQRFHINLCSRIKRDAKHAHLLTKWTAEQLACFFAAVSPSGARDFPCLVVMHNLSMMCDFRTYSLLAGRLVVSS